MFWVSKEWALPVIDHTWSHLFLNVNTCCRITHDQSQLQWTIVLNLSTTYFIQFKNSYSKQRQFLFELGYLILNLSRIVCFYFVCHNVVQGTQLITNVIYMQGSSILYALSINQKFLKVEHPSAFLTKKHV